MSDKKDLESLSKPANHNEHDLSMRTNSEEKKSSAFVTVSNFQVLAITTAYEQGVGKGHDAYNRAVEIQNPYLDLYGCKEAWSLGYEEGKGQASRSDQKASEALLIDWKRETDSPLLEEQAIYEEYQKTQGSYPNAEMEKSMRRVKSMLLSWWSWHRTAIVAALQNGSKKS